MLHGRVRPRPLHPPKCLQKNHLAGSVFHSYNRFLAVPARPRRVLSSQEVTLSGLILFPAFLAMELIEAHHPHLYRGEFGFRA